MTLTGYCLRRNILRSVHNQKLWCKRLRWPRMVFVEYLLQIVMFHSTGDQSHSFETICSTACALTKCVHIINSRDWQRKRFVFPAHASTALDTTSRDAFEIVAERSSDRRPSLPCLNTWLLCKCHKEATLGRSVEFCCRCKLDVPYADKTHCMYGSAHVASRQWYVFQRPPVTQSAFGAQARPRRAQEGRE